MKALVLAAGKGSRLGAASGGVPKPLTPVGGTTPLEHALAWVADQAPERIWVNVHEQADVVRTRVGERVGDVPISFSHEPDLLGTAGAWKKLEVEWSETSLVIYGDNIMGFDLSALRAAHATANAIVTIAVIDPDVHANTGPGGGRVDMKDGRVTRFVEGGAAGLINAGAYCVEPELARLLPEGFLDFGHDVLPRLAARGDLAAHVVEPGGFCMGVDTPARLELARSMIDGSGMVRR